MVVDDLWLQQYPKKDYDGIVEDVFRTISFVEEKQWEIVGLEEPLKSMTRRVDDLPKYNPYSNKKYMEQARKNNYMISSLIDFFVFHVPFIFLVVFIFNKILIVILRSISEVILPFRVIFTFFDIVLKNHWISNLIVNFVTMNLITFDYYDRLFFFVFLNQASCNRNNQVLLHQFVLSEYLRVNNKTALQFAKSIT